MRDLRALARPEAIRTDVREERFVEHTLQIAIQAALDVAVHIVSDQRLGEPETNRDLFRLLERGGMVPGSLTEKLENMAGFRNMIVHGYRGFDVDIVRDVVLNHVDDLLGEETLCRLRGRKDPARHPLPEPPE